MEIAILTMEKNDSRQKNSVGSSRIRGSWLLNHWKEAEEYKIGKKYDAIIFQKAYNIEFLKVYEGIKIFDFCDPDWLEKRPVKEVIELCDAFTTSTPALAEFLSQMTDKPVVCVPDRVDLTQFLQQKNHEGTAKTVGWYGYDTNQRTIDQCLIALKNLGLQLRVYSNAPYYPQTSIQGIDGDWIARNISNIKYDYETINDELLTSVDIIINPRLETGRFKYKSNNKTLTAWALGLPVAETSDELAIMMDADARKAEADKRTEELKENWDVRQSVEQMKNLIDELCKSRSQ